jgi:hypothetical protein
MLPILLSSLFKAFSNVSLVVSSSSILPSSAFDWAISSSHLSWPLESFFFWATILEMSFFYFLDDSISNLADIIDQNMYAKHSKATYLS